MRLQLAACFGLGLCLAGGALESAPRAALDRTMEQAAIGRWDITLQTPSGAVPSWLEIRRSGARALVGRFVGVSGSARPISRIEVNGSELQFAIPAQWENGTDDLSFRGRVQGDKMTGSMTLPDSKRHDWIAHRAPSLHRSTTPRWAKPIRLVKHLAAGEIWEINNRRPHAVRNMGPPRIHAVLDYVLPGEVVHDPDGQLRA